MLVLLKTLNWILINSCWFKPKILHIKTHNQQPFTLILANQSIWCYKVSIQK